MDVQATTEIRELSVEQAEAVTGGWLPAIFRTFYYSTSDLDCVQDPLGQGTTVGNCMIV
jgi:hypothetical protein